MENDEILDIVPEEPNAQDDVRKSILLLTKKKLGIAPDYTAFDEDIITDINSVFMILFQLGIGPKKPFMIEDKTATWDDFLEGKDSLEAVKTYLPLRVRLMFDPPTNSFFITSMENQIKELEIRMYLEAEIPFASTDGSGDDTL